MKTRLGSTTTASQAYIVQGAYTKTNEEVIGVSHGESETRRVVLGMSHN